MDKKKQTHKNMPTHISIVSYWEDKIFEQDIGIDWADKAHKRCWRCGKFSKSRKPERCHIIPSSLGGSNKPENFVLLCSECHKEAPNVNDKDAMWCWLKRTSTSFYDTLPSLKAFEEYEKMYGTRFESDLDDLFSSKFPKKTDLDYIIFFEFFSRAFDKKLTSEAIIHFGQGGLNSSTRAFLFREVLSTLQTKKRWFLSDKTIKEIREKRLNDFSGREEKEELKKRTPMSENEFLEKHEDIVSLLKKGLPNKQIAKETNKSTSTVYKVKKIFTNA